MNENEIPTNNPENTQSPVPQPPVAKPADSGVTPNFRGRQSGETQNLAGVPEEFMRLFEHDPSEIILYQALRHPFGVFAIYASAGVAVFLVIAFLGFIAADSDGLLGMNVSESAFGIILLIGILLMVLIAGISYAASYVYRKSRMILTNQKVVFFQYHSLFSREISQLNIGEVEDVNVAQKTIFDRIFRMGTITIETAGEQNNYVLTQVQDPHSFAHKTIQAHEGLIAEYGN
jgi:hypothetical protein